MCIKPITKIDVTNPNKGNSSRRKENTRTKDKSRPKKLKSDLHPKLVKLSKVDFSV